MSDCPFLRPENKLKDSPQKSHPAAAPGRFTLFLCDLPPTAADKYRFILQLG